MLIKARNKDVLSIPALQRAVLKHIYEPKKMTSDEVQQMEESIVNWVNHINLKESMAFSLGAMLGPIEQNIKLELEKIGLVLKLNEEGKLEGRKKLFKEKKIDYKKFHKLPEAYTHKDFIEAQKHLEKHKRDNPEYYN